MFIPQYDCPSFNIPLRFVQYYTVIDGSILVGPYYPYRRLRSTVCSVMHSATAMWPISKTHVTSKGMSQGGACWCTRHGREAQHGLSRHLGGEGAESRKAILPGPFEAMRDRQDARIRRQKLEGIEQRRTTATSPSSLPCKHTRTVAPAEPKESRPGHL